MKDDDVLVVDLADATGAPARPAGHSDPTVISTPVELATVPDAAHTI
jgi:hypothetical protein